MSKNNTTKDPLNFPTISIQTTKGTNMDLKEFKTIVETRSNPLADAN